MRSTLPRSVVLVGALVMFGGAGPCGDTTARPA